MVCISGRASRSREVIDDGVGGRVLNDGFGEHLRGDVGADPENALREVAEQGQRVESAGNPTDRPGTSGAVLDVHAHEGVAVRAELGELHTLGGTCPTQVLADGPGCHDPVGVEAVVLDQRHQRIEVLRDTTVGLGGGAAGRGVAWGCGQGRWDQRGRPGGRLVDAEENCLVQSLADGLLCVGTQVGPDVERGVVDDRLRHGEDDGDLLGGDQLVGPRIL